MTQKELLHYSKLWHNRKHAVCSKRLARLREAASAKPGPARPQAARRLRRTVGYGEAFEQRERRWRPFSTDCYTVSTTVKEGRSRSYAHLCVSLSGVFSSFRNPRSRVDRSRMPEMQYEET